MCQERLPEKKRILKNLARKHLAKTFHQKGAGQFHHRWGISNRHRPGTLQGLSNSLPLAASTSLPSSKLDTYLLKTGPGYQLAIPSPTPRFVAGFHYVAQTVLELDWDLMASTSAPECQPFTSEPG